MGTELLLALSVCTRVHWCTVAHTIWARGTTLFTKSNRAFLFIYPHLRKFFHCFERQGERERERALYRCERETSIGCLLLCTPTPDQELHPQPFSLQDDTPANWSTPARAVDRALKNVLPNPLKGLWKPISRLWSGLKTRERENRMEKVEVYSKR